jgi:hypothetical protein
MTQGLFYAIIFLFLLLYVMRGLLMVGYDNLKYKNNFKKSGTIAKGLITKLFTLKPLLQNKLTPKGVDYKVYERFQKKSTIYYAGLWICLFMMLFLGASIYMDAF